MHEDLIVHKGCILLLIDHFFNSKKALNGTYTAKNTTNLLQVVNFTSLLQLVNKFQQTCQFHHRGVYNYHPPPPPQRGKNVRVMGKKKTLEIRGKRKKGKREREMTNDSILMNNSMNINRWIINIWIFIMDTLIPQN